MVQTLAGVSTQLNGGVGFLMKKNKVSVIWGEAVIERAGAGSRSPRRRRRRCSRRSHRPQARSAPAPIRQSTSSSRPAHGPACLPGIEPDGKQVWTYFEAMVPQAIPKSLLVVGSGAIGIEFASFYRTMGSGGDGGRTAAADPPRRGCRDRGPARKRFEKQGIKIMTGAKVVALEKSGGSVVATIEDDKGKRTTGEFEQGDFGGWRRR